MLLFFHNRLIRIHTDVFPKGLIFAGKSEAKSDFEFPVGGNIPGEHVVTLETNFYCQDDSYRRVAESTSVQIKFFWFKTEVTITGPSEMIVHSVKDALVNAYQRTEQPGPRGQVKASSPFGKPKGKRHNLLGCAVAGSR